VAEYRFRPKARADIDGVWRYTVRTWGGPQARHYLAAIRDACAELAGRPALGKSRDELWRGLRSFPSGKPHFAVRGFCSKGRVGSSIAHRPRPAFRRRPPGRARRGSLLPGSGSADCCRNSQHHPCGSRGSTGRPAWGGCGPGAAIDVLASNRSLQRPFSEFIGVRNGLAVTSGAPFPGARL
jgi:plasmid stabilization system protein ParE